MKVVGFNLYKVSADKKKDAKPQLNLEISTNIKFNDIKEEKVDIFKDKEVLLFDFEFSVEYKKDFATILFRGEVAALFEEKNKGKEIIKQWKNKKISDDIQIPLFNLIIEKCSLQALQIEEQLAMPKHIPFPSLRKQQAANYTG